MSKLDEKGVLAACEAYHSDLPTHDYPSKWAMEQAITAYLSAASPGAPEDVADSGLWRFWNGKAREYLERAETAEAELARLTARLAEAEKVIDDIVTEVRPWRGCLALADRILDIYRRWQEGK